VPVQSPTEFPRNLVLWALILLIYKGFERAGSENTQILTVAESVPAEKFAFELPMK
jgi:hypothetical protein